MRKVIGIGETVLDIIFRDDQPIQAVPGGSAFNALISLGRTGMDACFISEVGNDRVGENTRKFMVANGVDDSAVSTFPESKSPLSLAFLDEQNNADYVFYKDHPHDRLDFTTPTVAADDIVIFGSFFALNPVIRQQVLGFLTHAKEQGAILYYDVNFRASHQHELMKIRPNLLENFELSDIVRGSNEDFGILFNKQDADSIYRAEISFYTKNFIYTQGADPVSVFGQGGFRKDYPTPVVEAVSTIGAGDNFNAGFIYALVKYNIRRADLEAGLTEAQWAQLITEAQQFSANVCHSINNSVDHDFAATKRQELEQALADPVFPS